MKNNIIKMNYQSILNLIETERAIKIVKDTFEQKLQAQLTLTRVSAPLFVAPETGLNDNLNGHEKAVNFKSIDLNKDLEIVQSLAKWKRNALKLYNFEKGTGLYTDMNAIRPFEELDNIHSLYVDQWDWEKIIVEEERNYDFLKSIVQNIYQALRQTAEVVEQKYPVLKQNLPPKITFVSTYELEEMYPNLSRKERENAISKLYGAVFIHQIGWPLKDGKPHDGRAADYDDWLLNGDILVWYDVLEIALELTSMGIRVNNESLRQQLKYKNELYKMDNPYGQDILNNRLPLTIGGGIGQSRMCMFLLKKIHIGEVQSSEWSEEDKKAFQKIGVQLL